MVSPSSTITGSTDGLIVCVDFGSTFTKALLVDLSDSRILGSAEHRTTIDTDVLDGYDACLARLVDQDPRASNAEVRACSSAGGGLRIAVVGNEELVTAEAGRRVALSSGGKVVAVVAAAKALDNEVLHRAAADVVLLTGGTDGGNAEVLLRAARWLVDSGWTGPVVVAGNVEAQAEVSEILSSASTAPPHTLPHTLADNALPTIGRLAPESARSAIRETFLAHVIGGKGLSARGGGADFVAMVRGATPDVVLTGVEVLAAVTGDVAVVDVGGATTDVHSVVALDPEDRGLSREVVATTAVTRTVEGDLGLRWSASSTVEAAGRGDLAAAARVRTAQPAFLPTTGDEWAEDEAIARAAVGLALRRHAGRSRVVLSPHGRVVERSGRDLREVDLLVGSGGALRHGSTDAVEKVLRAALRDEGDGAWQLPERARVVVDQHYVLVAVGLLASDHPDVAAQLARSIGVP